jgi:outer membrane protein assembly factor BamA
MLLLTSSVAWWLSVSISVHAGEVAKPTAVATEEGGAWATGMDAASIGLPGSLASSDSSVNPATVITEKRGEFLAVPIPRVDPALGTGLVGAAAYIFRLDPEDMESPPSIIGAGALWMDSGSWGGGLGGKFYLKEDRFRVTTGLAYADLRYDLITTSANTQSLVTVPLSQEAYGGVAHAQLRIAPSSYVGMRMQLGKLGTTLRAGDLPDLPASIDEDLGVVLQVNSLGPTFALDTRDNAYYPRDGIALDAGVDVYFGALGSEISFQRYGLNYRQYRSMRERDVLAWQAYLCAAGGDPPFFLQCQVGPMSVLRGYSFGEYRGNAMAAAQVEYRWQLHPRWILAMFGGVAQVASEFGSFDFDENLYAGGAGVRFVVEPKNGVTLRIDYAVGQDDDAIYVSVGEAF